VASHPWLINIFAANADLLAKLVEKHARFVIVGGTAVHFYLPERHAKDLDLLIDPVLANARLVIDAINSGGLHNYQIEPGMLTKRKVQLPNKSYYYADILIPDEATEFENVWANSIEVNVAHSPLRIQARIAGISALIALLSSSDDEKHKRDIDSLSKLGDVHGQKA
jgi:hypothetical protein